MSNRQTRDRGNLFANPDKKKPSQPDLQGDCTLDMATYEIRGWKRGDQLAITLAPPRGDRNTYPPDVFRGELDAGPPARPVRAGARGAKEAEPVATPAWAGDIVSDEVAYTVRAFEKQGKSGLYFTLSFERVDPAARAASHELAD